MNSRSSGHLRNHTQPSSKKKNAKVALATAIGAMGWQLLAGSSHQAVAQPIYFWDPLGTGGTGSSESAGWSYNPATADWYNGTALPDVDWNDNTGTSTIADFALTGDTATISGANVGALGLIFGAGGDVITGTSTLLLGSSGITTAGGTTTISASGFPGRKLDIQHWLHPCCLKPNLRHGNGIYHSWRRRS